MLVLLQVQGASRGEPPLGARPTTYHSPYQVQFTYPLKELLADLEQGRRGDPRQQSSIPFSEWTSQKVLKRYGPWGPPARHYPPPAGLDQKSAAWKRERVIAVALRYQGYAYQHHHVPDWDPPANWPWKETALGHNSKGLDCSNFSSFAYNQALGIKPNSDVKKQSELVEITAAEPGRTVHVQRIKVPPTHADFARVLRTGDLLFIRNNSDEISHVVLWVGAIGQSPDHLPLILDSHGAGVKDSNGGSIPSGVYLRPFRENSWYHRKADHALRLIPDE